VSGPRPLGKEFFFKKEKTLCRVLMLGALGKVFLKKNKYAECRGKGHSANIFFKKKRKKIFVECLRPEALGKAIFLKKTLHTVKYFLKNKNFVECRVGQLGKITVNGRCCDGQKCCRVLS
jgi:hypothetical protein